MKPADHQLPIVTVDPWIHQAPRVLLTTSEGPDLPAALPAVHLDSSLIMNVLNQIAAQDFKNQPLDAQLVFLLSDYLREGMHQQRMRARTPPDIFQLAETHLRLFAAMRGVELKILIVSHWTHAAFPAYDAIVRIATVLMGIPKERIFRKWRMQIVVRNAPSLDQDFVMDLDLHGTAKPSPKDLQNAYDHCQAVLLAGSPRVDLLRLVWNADKPRRLSMSCKVMPAL